MASQTTFLDEDVLEGDEPEVYDMSMILELIEAVKKRSGDKLIMDLNLVKYISFFSRAAVSEEARALTSGKGAVSGARRVRPGFVDLGLGGFFYNFDSILSAVESFGHEKCFEIEC